MRGLGKLTGLLRGASSATTLTARGSVAVGSRDVHSGNASASPIPIDQEPYCRQRNELVLGNRIPVKAPDAWVAPSAVIIGDVDLYERVSVWYGAVLRGDLNAIRVDCWSNIQDRTVIHAARTSPTGLSAATSIGKYVTVGPNCMLRSCKIEDLCVIGEKSVVMEGCVIQTNAVLAPGSVLPPGKLVPSKELWGGNPARKVRDLTPDEIADIQVIAEKSFAMLDAHQAEFLPHSTAWRQAQNLREKVGMF
ncbi:hypothetical protein BSKO_00714 [Bryopsis sp. KO-2023]|nr:hypothetical protein BSKO_00714 [Bryopsis sp. KO-2023]